MRELLIATSNKGKFEEMMEVLEDLPYKFLFLKDLDISSDGLVEDGDTFRENAYKKARFFHDMTGLLTLAEDSGILVDALPGELGVKTRRWGAGEFAGDEEWIDYFMRRMEREEQRTAKFVCSACLLDGSARTIDDAQFFEGETRGVLTNDLQAPIISGIPISSCFIPTGFNKVYAAMSKHEKNSVSHRGKAMWEVRKSLEEK